VDEREHLAVVGNLIDISDDLEQHFIM
jgi:hypothetical protein